jgi:hypothetical protein
MTLPNNIKTGNNITITCATDKVPEDNYYILQCDFTPSGG